ncbi:hypothetical protein NGM99_06185 [Mesorhizobium sp. RP14(2022)]|uniref:Small CPxCG-related zinc finger protein n=1 Tax=Mesorhizobium liriopis TaxID=2953882 RepID=A0ABT1C3H1_9HYPH|nr:hypothetical protein [Mesorhizobium liriopis]MCO6049376.1 hypothetical protein [Mesorhizobium liriopis]
MADICIKCPSTGETVATGQTIEPENFETTDLGMQTFQCPACDETHTWNKRDAFLRDSDAGMD